MDTARTPAQVNRHFGEVDAAGTLYERVAVALSDTDGRIGHVSRRDQRSSSPEDGIVVGR